MSHSPIRAQGSEDAEDFLAAQNQLSKFLRAGMSWSGNERNCCFLNTGGQRFADISAVSGFDFVDDGRAVATVDWDFDGDLDVWAVNRTGPQVRYLRNQLATENRSIALRLIGDGKTSNRDAIGARVEVVVHGDSDHKLVKTLRAGEGYLSQSSKWFHFGLGQAKAIDHVIVHWPGGAAERFGNVTPGRHYELSQETGQARRWNPPQIRVENPSSPKPQPRPIAASRTVFRSRFPLPPLKYTNLERQLVALERSTGKPLLINLWATWCAPCVEELGDLTEHAEKLRQAGVDVLALNVESASDDSQISVEDVHKFLARRGFPFQAGLAGADALTQLDAFYRAMFIYHPRLPVPTSFLLDSRGQVVILYKGRVSVETLLEDVRLLDVDDDDDLYRLALPFPGRDYGRPAAINLADLAFRLTGDEQFDLGSYYLKLAREAVRSEVTPRFFGSLAKAHYNMAVEREDQADTEAAMRHYTEALKLDPNLCDARFNLAVLLTEIGQPQNAIKQYSELIAVDPSFRDAHYNLAVLLAEKRQIDAAIRHYKHTLHIAPDYFKAHNNIGKLFAESGQVQLAIDHYERALEYDPDNIDTLNNLGNAYVQLKQIADAVLLFERVLALNERDARTHYNYGTALDAQKKYAEAAKHYLRATELDSKNALAHNNLGVALVRLGQFDHAEYYFRAAIKLDPSYRSAQENLDRLISLREKLPPPKEP